MAARYGAAQPVAGYAAVAGYGRDYADPYLGHGIGPMAGYGVSIILTFEEVDINYFCFRLLYIVVVIIDLHPTKHICSSIRPINNTQKYCYLSCVRSTKQHK